MENDRLFLGNAFIGISLDSSLFSREWIKLALSRLTKKHEKILFLLADDLFRYTRSVRKTQDFNCLDIHGIDKKILKLTGELTSFLTGEVKKNCVNRSDSIYIKRWRDFADYEYVRIFRNLRIAYLNIVEFKESVDSVANSHYQSNNEKIKFNSALSLSSEYVLDEIAMCLRVSEIDIYNFEYYPCEEINCINDLYSGKFSKYNLTVKELIGKQPKRQFEVIEI